MQKQVVRIISTIQDDVVTAADETLRRAGLTRSQAVRMMFIRLASGDVPMPTVFSANAGNVGNAGK